MHNKQKVMLTETLESARRFRIFLFPRRTNSPSSDNAWELKSESPYQRRWARSAAYQAKKLFPEGSSIIIQTKKNPKKDMYARYIAEIVCNGENISDALIKLKGVKIFSEE